MRKTVFSFINGDETVDYTLTYQDDKLTITSGGGEVVVIKAYIPSEEDEVYQTYEDSIETGYTDKQAQWLAALFLDAPIWRRHLQLYYLCLTISFFDSLKVRFHLQRC